MSSLTSIGWFAAVLLPLFILLIWAMVYLFQRQEFKNNLSSGTVSCNLELIMFILAFLVTVCLMFAIYCSVSFGPWYGLPLWLVFLLVIILFTAIGLLAIFDNLKICLLWIKDTLKNWPWRSLELHSLKLLQWVSMVSRDGTRIIRGALKLLRRNEYNPDQFDGHQGVSRQRKPSQRRHQK